MVEIEDALGVFQRLRENRPGTFDVDVGAFLGGKADRFVADLEIDKAVESRQDAVQFHRKLGETKYYCLLLLNGHHSSRTVDRFSPAPGMLL
jgi:hypothetical protein